MNKLVKGRLSEIIIASKLSLWSSQPIVIVCFATNEALVEGFVIVSAVDCGLDSRVLQHQFHPFLELITAIQTTETDNHNNKLEKLCKNQHAECTGNKGHSEICMPHSN